MNKKITIIVNPTFTPASLMNAIGHLLLGLGHQAESIDLCMTQYFDQNQKPVTFTSDHSFVILKAKTETKLKNFHQKVVQSNLLHNAFYETMFADPLDLQSEKISQSTAEQILVAVALFGDKEAVEPLTKKFSVYK